MWGRRPSDRSIVCIFNVLWRVEGSKAQRAALRALILRLSVQTEGFEALNFFSVRREFSLNRAI